MQIYIPIFVLSYLSCQMKTVNVLNIVTDVNIASIHGCHHTTQKNNLGLQTQTVFVFL